MATPKLVKGGYFDLLVGNGANPQVFTKICGLNTKTFTYQKNSSDVFVPDCDDPESIPDRYLNITGRQWDISASGLYNRAQADLIRSLLDTFDSSVMRFVMSEPDGESVDDGYWQGPAQLLNAQFGGPVGGEYSSIDLTIASDGHWAWSDAA